MNTSEPVHEAVKAHYGAIASGQTKSCCGPDCCADEPAGARITLYDSSLTESLPAEVTDLSLGCGDPVTIASLKPGETVLDLGSGGGIDCFLAGRQVGETGYVIGVDMTPAMLAQANANKVRMGVTNVEFRRGQIEQLPVVDSSIDVAISNCVINLSPDKEAVFRELIRVLKPGGRVALSDIVTEGEFKPEQRADSDMWCECVSGAIDARAYVDLMSKAGFVDVRINDKADWDGSSKPLDGPVRTYSGRITATRPR